ncbi:hypothetical protein E3983_06250 [Legionella israelensis]|uniref:Flagellar FliJ protein n=1 Tax=Legionella israelensis TaxID=454 RepID=A0AAX1EFY3_9GAMM|nr:hypothetical protein [Legionella israelensis]QBR83986.1 hypothetical protein E3983_06250 [Legionella israelensis]
MSKNIQAIQFKIDFKLKDVQQKQITIMKEIENIHKTIDKKTVKLNNTDKLSATIVPEVEIARMSFFVQLQQEIAVLIKQLQELKKEKARLDNMELRLKTEQKLIENYANRQHQKEQQQQIRQQYLELDEWIVQRGATYES